MRPFLLKTRATKGESAFLAQIRNCVAGCKAKWKTMSKVESIIVIRLFYFYAITACEGYLSFKS